ncbi:uncharacterized protein LOC141629274 [Silene latifolia]|uniref:uncharacterized protein LOC141629274 n=1 Tax=Silene latifolia TaxID=37657 RepID=UPI003D77B325
MHNSLSTDSVQTENPAPSSGTAPTMTKPVSKKVTWVDNVTQSVVGMELRSIHDSNQSGEVVIKVDDVQSELDYWFSIVENMNTILRGNAWSLSGHSLILKQWTPLFPTQLDTISKSASALRKIASKIGTPLYADPITTNKERLSFARVMVEVDLSGPLPDNVVINSPFMGQVIQDVEYEWLPYYCTHCEKLGHEKKVCKQLKQKAKPKVTNLEPGCSSTDGHMVTKENNNTISETVLQIVVDLTLGSKAQAVDSGGGCEPELVVSVPAPLLVVTEQQSQAPIPVSLNQFGILESVEDGMNGAITIGSAKKLCTKVQQLSIPKGSTWLNRRIWIIWKDSSLTIQVLNISSQWIHLSISHGFHVPEATFVYGFNHHAQRLPLWDFLVSNAGCSTPWLVLGDVNCVRTTKERISSGPPNTATMNEFNEVVANDGLDEIRAQGYCFTWSNKQDHEERKWVRLDRTMVNSFWFLAFPVSYEEALTARISDHSPLVISLEANVPAKNYSFKYLNYWRQDPQFKPIVNAEWETSIKGCAMYKLV